MEASRVCANPCLREVCRSSTSRRRRQPNPNLSPISAAGYFEQATQVTVPSSGLEFRVYYTPPKFADGTVMVCHHGAGWSGLTFAAFAKEVATLSGGECGVLALDCRGHGAPSSTISRLIAHALTGKTIPITGSDANELDLSIETLTSDLVNLLSMIFTDASTAPSLLVRVVVRSASRH